MRNLSVLALSLVLGSLAVAGDEKQAGSDWPQWLGPQRDSSSPAVVRPWKKPLEVLWSQPIGEGHSSPVIAGGKVFLHTLLAGKNEEALTAYDSKTGKQLWQSTYARGAFKSLFGNGPRGTPAIVQGKAYTLGITGLLTCFDVRDGKQLWQVDTLKDYKAAAPFFGVSGSPLIESELVFVNVGGKGASIVAFDRDTGKERWKALDDRASYSSPVGIGTKAQRQVVFLTAQRLVALAPDTGKVFWDYPLVDKLAESSTTPVVCGETLFGSSITFGGVGLDLDKEAEKPAAKQSWINPDLTCYFSTPVAVGAGELYLVTGTKPPALLSKATLRCVEAKTGKELWQRDRVGTYHAALLRTGDDKLLLLEEAGNLVLLQPDRAAYRELARSPICGSTWAHPALADGLLYVRDGKKLVCVELP